MLQRAEEWKGRDKLVTYKKNFIFFISVHKEGVNIFVN